MFARPAEMEPGMWSRADGRGEPLEWGGVEPISSRFAGKHRVRVRVLSGGSDFVCDATKRFQVIDWRTKERQA